MLLAENKYKNLKQAGEWGNLSEAEAEIVALSAKIDVLKHKKKPEGKSRKEEKNSKTRTIRKRRNLRKRKQTFVSKNPEPTK